MKPINTLVLAGLVACGIFAQHAADLKAPIRIKSGDALIDVVTGHAAPSMRDMDGDGLKDLLVGEFGSGTFPESEFLTDASRKFGSHMAVSRVRVYRNVGTATAPRFDGFEYMKTKEGAASIPMT